MENFSVNITIDDCCYNKCHVCRNSVTKDFTDFNESIQLQCCYYFRIISATNTYILISVDNGTIHFVRRAFIGVPLKLCIPNNCSQHIITITVNSITVL